MGNDKQPAKGSKVGDDLKKLYDDPPPYLPPPPYKEAQHHIPFPRNPDLVPRPELDQISGPTTLYGIAGVGKTQLAIEYSYRQTPDTWVLWIESYDDIATLVGIPAYAVEQWLQESRHLIVLDGVELDMPGNVLTTARCRPPSGHSIRIDPTREHGMAMSASIAYQVSHIPGVIDQLTAEIAAVAVYE